jgi:polyferredoxin
LGTGGEPVETSPRPETREWLRSGMAAVLILILSWVGFMFVPDRLLAFLSTRVTPHARDALVTLWVAFFFVVMSVLFVAFQRRWRV